MQQAEDRAIEIGHGRPGRPGKDRQDGGDEHAFGQLHQVAQLPDHFQPSTLTLWPPCLNGQWGQFDTLLGHGENT